MFTFRKKSNKRALFKSSLKNVRQLQNSVDRFNRIVLGSRGYGFFDWDLAKKIMHWDGGLWGFLGYTDADMSAISNSELFFEFVHPEDREKLNRALKRMVKEESSGEAIFRIKKKLGGHIWVESRVGLARDTSNRVTHISGIAFDVTKLKQTEQALLLSEARHARILQSSNDGIWEWSAEHGGFHFSNRCWEHLGYSEHDDFVNQGIDRVQAWRNRIHPDDLSKFDQSLEGHLSTDKPFDIEYRIMGKDQRWRWIRARGQMTYNAQGEPYRMSGTNMDITQVKRAEERVLLAKDGAEKANRAKSQFLSNMSHELRTPLNAILGFAQLFDNSDNLNLAQRDNINEIRAAGQHLLRLIGDVLDLAKIESGRMRFCVEDVLPATIIKECASLIKAAADQRNIRIQVALNGLDEQLLKSDAMRLKQVILNLLSNGVKYNRDGGRLNVDCMLTKNQRFKISVEDTGKGIPECLHDQVFQPFNRLGAESSNIEGTGVGLVISQQIVHQMGGYMGFSSAEGLGSTFWLELPLTMDDIEAVVDEPGPVASSFIYANSGGEDRVELSVLGKKRVLYVEDNPPNQRLMEQALGQYSQIELTVVGEAFRGLFEARTNPPDLILLDINLPGMDGYETLEILRRDPITKNIPVVAVSANAMAHDIKRGQAAGFDRYLTKPVNLVELVTYLNDLLGERVAP